MKSLYFSHGEQLGSFGTQCAGNTHYMNVKAKVPKTKVTFTGHFTSNSSLHELNWRPSLTQFSTPTISQAKLNQLKPIAIHVIALIWKLDAVKRQWKGRRQGQKKTIVCDTLTFDSFVYNSMWTGCSYGAFFQIPVSVSPFFTSHKLLFFFCTTATNIMLLFPYHSRPNGTHETASTYSNTCHTP